jgi:hypothetical protein
LLAKRQKHFSAFNAALAIPPRRDLYGKKSYTLDFCFAVIANVLSLDPRIFFLIGWCPEITYATGATEIF